MNINLTREQVEDLLDEVIQVDKRRDWKGDSCQMCCPVHGESNPSMGVTLDYEIDDSVFTSFHCFSCGAKGNMATLLHLSLPDEFPTYGKAFKFIIDRYSLSRTFKYLTRQATVRRYEEKEEVKKEEDLPLSFIAPFKSGKETYSYFYERGFTKETVKKFRIGRDLINETVTVPIIVDTKLKGVIGRFIDPNRPQNERFKIYNFNKGNFIFPYDSLDINDFGILVEGLFDPIYMHQLGYSNCFTTFTNSITKAQADIIKSKYKNLLLLHDNDKRGYQIRDVAKELLKGVNLYVVDTYPEYGKDVLDWDKRTIQSLIDNKISLTATKIRKIRRM